METQVFHSRASKALLDGASLGDPALDGLADDGSLRLVLEVRDAEVIQFLLDKPEGLQRDDLALDALRIGVLALRHATGRLDADLISRETSRLLEQLEGTLSMHARTTHDRVQGSLKEYFDPHDGRFNERVARLVSEDGELAKLLKVQLDGDHSQLARTLTAHVGSESPLMKLLDPKQSEGLLSALRGVVETQLLAQSQRVLSEFSLDNGEGALSRLVRELTSKHGDLSNDLKGKIDAVVKEFSLDADDSALSRLKKKLDEAHSTIVKQFSLNEETSAFSQLKRMLETTQGSINRNLTLDDDGSPLSRLKREITTILEAQVKSNADFQDKVTESLAKIIQKKETEAKTTLHGFTFEDALYQFLSHDCQTCGHVIESTGSKVGSIPRCLKGDVVVTLCGADGPGANVVFEAKESQSVTLRQALEELAEARKNRQAEVGVFVFSKKSAPADLLPLKRYGCDVVVVWDAEDPSTNPFLQAAFEFAKAYAIDRGKKQVVGEMNFEAIEKALTAIEKAAGNLDEIEKLANTIQSNGGKILDRVRIDRGTFAKQVVALRESVAKIHAAVTGQSS